jgi:hypothetical protein
MKQNLVPFSGVEMRPTSPPSSLASQAFLIMLVSPRGAQGSFSNSVLCQTFMLSILPEMSVLFTSLPPKA